LVKCGVSKQRGNIVGRSKLFDDLLVFKTYLLKSLLQSMDLLGGALYIQRMMKRVLRLLEEGPHAVCSCCSKMLVLGLVPSPCLIPAGWNSH
jgi:hypothetical protein